MDNLSNRLPRLQRDSELSFSSLRFHLNLCSPNSIPTPDDGFPKSTLDIQFFFNDAWYQSKHKLEGERKLEELYALKTLRPEVRGKGVSKRESFSRNRRLLSKMRFMPSSLSSNSHRLLTALVDSQHKKVYKVKNCFTNIDPEREKEQKERAESQTIRANELLSRKKEKVNRKYTQTVRRERQLSPGFLEDALDEDDEGDYNESRRSAARRCFEEDLEMEARAEKRIINAKKSQGQKNIPHKSLNSSRRPIDFSESEREESEYETEGEEEERSPQRRRVEELEEEDEYEEDGHQSLFVYWLWDTQQWSCYGNH